MDASTWYVYLLQCSDDSLYCGVTTDLPRRLRQHNGELPGGARYTRARRPVGLLASAPFPDQAAACRAEYAIKQVPRAHKPEALQRESLAAATAQAGAHDPPEEDTIE